MFICKVAFFLLSNINADVSRCKGANTVDKVKQLICCETWSAMKHGEKRTRKTEKLHLKFSKDSLKPWHHVRQGVVYVTDSSVASHKHVWRFHFSTCHFATASMFGFFFISPWLIQNSWGGWLWIPIFLSRKHPILLFLPHFEELDVRHSGELTWEN